MDTSQLTPAIERFIEALESEPELQEHLEQHKQRQAQASELLQIDTLENITVEELHTLLEDTDAWYGVRGKQRFWRRLLGEDEEELPDVRESLIELVRRGERGITAEDFNYLVDSLYGLGTAYISELLALRFPERYWLLNKPVRDFLDEQNIDVKDELPWGSKGDKGKFYLAVGRHLDDVRRSISEVADESVDYMLTDLYIYWYQQRDFMPESDTQQPIAVDEESQREFSGFKPDTFRFLQELRENNSKEWMHKNDKANLKRYQRVLREPLRDLFETVCPTISELNPNFETEAKYGKVLAGIRKRFPDEEGEYHHHYWGAFYRQDRKKQTDAQLFVIVHRDHVNVGLSIAGARGSDVLDRFRENLNRDPETFFSLIKSLPSDVHVAVAESHGLYEKRILQLEDTQSLKQLTEWELIDIERRYAEGTPILYQPAFADEVSRLFYDLYPLYRFVVAEDKQMLREVATTYLVEALDEEVEEIEEPQYTLAQLRSETYTDSSLWGQIEALLRDKKQLIFYGPPGTGKTFIAQKFAKYWVDAGDEPGGEIQVVQFHPSYAYEEFVEGIRPQSVDVGDGRRELSYPVHRGVFRKLGDRARTAPNRRHVMILDEINRGELPRILGELLYLLEYRKQTVTLPYSGERFSIPENLFIVGTMNTADRSIAIVDHALRRRFHFVAMKPDTEILRSYLQNQRPEMEWAADVLEELNRKLEEDGIDWHLHIGHSHFMRPDLDDRQLRLIWQHSILPMLEEYFYRQPQVLDSYDLMQLRAAVGAD